MTTKEVLVEARALVEKGWVQGASAVDENGNKVKPSAQSACRWCATGAVSAISDIHYSRAIHALANFIESKRLNGSSSIVLGFNDKLGQTQDAVLEVFDKAIMEADNDD